MQWPIGAASSPDRSGRIELAIPEGVAYLTVIGNLVGVYLLSSSPSTTRYLGAGNSQWNNVSGFANFGLPVGKLLRVFDRGCGDYCGSYVNGMQTNDAITVTGANAVSYQVNHFGSQNYCASKSLTLSQDGVIVCQVK